MKQSQIEFTPREQWVVATSRDTKFSTYRRVSYDATFLVVSLGFLVWAYFRADLALAGVGYGVLFWRVASGLFRSLAYASVYRSIFDKYEEKIKELSDAPEKSTQ